MQTIDQIAEAAAAAIHAEYWRMCDVRKSAIHPSEITIHGWVADLLDEAFEIAMRCEADPDGWEEGRSKF